MVRTLVRALAVVPLLALPLAPTPVSASQTNASISIVQQATLISATTVAVTVHYTCLPPNTAIFLGGPQTSFLAVDVDQSGVQGSGFVVANCNDQNNTATVDVSPGPYVPGTAAASAFLSNADFSSTATGSAEITIK
jgi:hypothetical protein